MASNESDIWKGKEFVSIISKCNVPFNRYNLKKYFLSHDFESICAESIIEYFGKDEISKKDEETGCYLSHLLFLEGYNVDEVSKIYDHIFDEGYITPYEINDRGQLFVECLLQYPELLIAQNKTYNILENIMKKYPINLTNHVDFQGNNIAHWLIASYVGSTINYYFKFFSYNLFNKKNKNGISPNNLMDLIDIKMNIIELKEIENSLILDIRRRYENNKSSEEKRIYLKDEILLKFITYNHFCHAYNSFPSQQELRGNSSKFNTFKR